MNKYTDKTASGKPHPMQIAFQAFIDAIDEYDDPEDNYEWIDDFDAEIETIRNALCKRFGHFIRYADHCGRIEHDLCDYCRSYRESIKNKCEKIIFDFRQGEVTNGNRTEA